MRGERATDALRSAVTVLTVTAAAIGLTLLASVTAGIQLLTNTLLVMGGNDNPLGLTPVMQQQLGGDPWYPAPDPDPLRPVGTFGQGYIDTVNNPNSPYFGWDFTRVQWPSQIGLPILGQWAYEPAQQQGVHNIDTDIAAVLPTLGPGEKVIAFGYSSSANVMVREMRQLQNQPGGPTGTGQLEFFLMAGPNRPNGGIMERFPGLYFPFVDVRFDGATPIDTPYPTTDISWQYDTAADFPNYPLNLLAVANSFMAASTLHGNYYPADFNGPRAFPDTTVGNITYITLKPPHLPLLLSLYYRGFPKPLLDLVEPALTVMVDWGYDRSISPGTPTPAKLIPRIRPIPATVDLINAIGQGVRNFIADLRPTAVPADTVAPAAAVAPARPSPAIGNRDAVTPAGAARPTAHAAGKATAGSARSVTAPAAAATRAPRSGRAA